MPIKIETELQHTSGKAPDGYTARVFTITEEDGTVYVLYEPSYWDDTRRHTQFIMTSKGRTNRKLSQKRMLYIRKLLEAQGYTPVVI